MSTSSKTYELVVGLRNGSANKEEVMSWLQMQGESNFVEGFVDGIDLEFDYLGQSSSSEDYESLGGNDSPISIYKYDLAELTALKNHLDEKFGEGLASIISHDTSTWQNGWKDSFKPIFKDGFCVHPPWDKPRQTEDAVSIEIDPGMAFGTGQHHTTQLCLGALSWIDKNLSDHEISSQKVLDVGTGSGVLAIAAVKLGFCDVVASDIDVDAVRSANENCQRNFVDVKIQQGSVIKLIDGTPVLYDLVIANILGTVLRRIFLDLVSSLSEKGKLVLSGILVDEIEEFKKIADSYGLVVCREESLEGWSMLVLEKNENDQQT